jgi:pantetheine-phosphate adenylyltransferase
MIKKPFKLIGLGGTFDHLHEGHRLLLSTAAKLGDHIALALTTEALLKNKKHHDLLDSYETREKKVCHYLESEVGLSSNDYTIIPLSDPYGPAITDSTLEAHISSVETHDTAIKINEIRVERGLPPMILIIIPIVFDSAGVKMSSTDIRSKIK